MSDESYLFEGGSLIIKDKARGLDKEGFFSPPLIPENLSEGEKSASAYQLVIEKNSEGFIEQVLLKKGQIFEGESRLYYPCGAVKAQMYYDESKLHGPSRYYSKEGRLLSESWFWKGKKNGKCIQYYPCGKIYSKQYFLEGLEDGLQEFFYQSGSIKSSMSFVKGLLDGTVCLYHEGSSKKREMQFKMGSRFGLEQQWYENGQLMMEKEHENEKAVGRERHWFLNGQIAEERLYLSCPEHFNFEQFNDEGQRLRKGTFDSENRYLESVWDDEGRLVEEKRGHFEGQKIVWEKS